MRSFEQRREEIFRRSDERIKAKKRRRSRLIAVCVPLALCVGLLWISRSPREGGESVTDFHSVTEGTTPADGALDGTDQTGSYNGSALYFSDAAQVERIMQIIDSLSGSGNLQDGSDSIDGVSGLDPQYEYTILLENGSGTAAYTLSGSTLIDQQTFVTYKLSEQELFELKQALGI